MYKKAWEELKKYIKDWYDFEDRQLERAIKEHNKEQITRHVVDANTLAMILTKIKRIEEGQ